MLTFTSGTFSVAPCKRARTTTTCGWLCWVFFLYCSISQKNYFFSTTAPGGTEKDRNAGDHVDNYGSSSWSLLLVRASSFQNHAGGGRSASSRSTTTSASSNKGKTKSKSRTSSRTNVNVAAASGLSSTISNKINLDNAAKDTTSATASSSSTIANKKTAATASENEAGWDQSLSFATHFSSYGYKFKSEDAANGAAKTSASARPTAATSTSLSTSSQSSSHTVAPIEFGIEKFRTTSASTSATSTSGQAHRFEDHDDDGVQDANENAAAPTFQTAEQADGQTSAGSVEQGNKQLKNNREAATSSEEQAAVAASQSGGSSSSGSSTSSSSSAETSSDVTAGGTGQQGEEALSGAGGEGTTGAAAGATQNIKAGELLPNHEEQATSNTKSDTPASPDTLHFPRRARDGAAEENTNSNEGASATSTSSSASTSTTEGNKASAGSEIATTTNAESAPAGASSERAVEERTQQGGGQLASASQQEGIPGLNKGELLPNREEQSSATSSSSDTASTETGTDESTVPETSTSSGEDVAATASSSTSEVVSTTSGSATQKKNGSSKNGPGSDPRVETEAGPVKAAEQTQTQAAASVAATSSTETTKGASEQKNFLSSTSSTNQQAAQEQTQTRQNEATASGSLKTASAEQQNKQLAASTSTSTEAGASRAGTTSTVTGASVASVATSSAQQELASQQQTAGAASSSSTASRRSGISTGVANTISLGAGAGGMSTSSFGAGAGTAAQTSSSQHQFLASNAGAAVKQQTTSGKTESQQEKQMQQQLQQNQQQEQGGATSNMNSKLSQGVYLANEIVLADQPSFEQPAKNFEDVYYTVPIHVGGQELDCVPDTGSFSILVLSKQCDSCGDVLSYLTHVFDPTESEPPVHHLDQYAEITFGSGAVHVEGGQTSVKLGRVTVTKQKMWEIKQMDTGMQNIWDQGARFEGILGMGMANWVPDSRDESTLLSNAQITKFGMCLGDVRDKTSKIYWGQYPAGITYHVTPVVGKKHWAIQVTSFGVGTKEDDLQTCDPCAAVVDSGTSSLGAPSGLLSTLEGMIVDKEGQGLLSDCSNQKELPDIVLGLKGTDGKSFHVTIPASWYVKASDSGDCKLSLMTTPLPTSRDFGPVWLLGQPFIREYLVMYDRGEKPTMSFSRREGTPGDMTACPTLNGNPTELTFPAQQVDSANETLVTSNTPLQGEDILIHKKHDHQEEATHASDSSDHNPATIIFPESQPRQEVRDDSTSSSAKVSSKSPILQPANVPKPILPMDRDSLAAAKATLAGAGGAFPTAPGKTSLLETEQGTTSSGSTSVRSNREKNQEKSSENVKQEVGIEFTLKAVSKKAKKVGEAIGDVPFWTLRNFADGIY